LTAETWFSV